MNTGVTLRGVRLSGQGYRHEGREPLLSTCPRVKKFSFHHPRFAYWFLPVVVVALRLL